MDRGRECVGSALCKREVERVVVGVGVTSAPGVLFLLLECLLYGGRVTCARLW